MSKVLLLNQDYSPIMVCTVQRAFLLLYLKKAELVLSAPNKLLRSVKKNYPFPSVIKSSRYVHIPYKGVVLTRQNVFKRDGFECQYCGSKKDLTLDHLIPRSKGGKSSWTNLVTACKTCNSKKGDYTPEEMGLTLKTKPIKPSYLLFLKSSKELLQDQWLPFLEPKKSAS